MNTDDLPNIAETKEPVISVRDLTVRLPAGMDRENAVSNISFDIAPGEILCVVGESGSGKSVTANAIMGLLPKSVKVVSGAIRLCGTDLLSSSEGQLRNMRGRVVSIVFQDPLSALNPLMTIGAQIAEVLEEHGVGNKAQRAARVLELLNEVGLPDPELLKNQYPFQLSGGQRQRVMIAIALALEPKLLIADEPTTALDVTTQAQILDLIRRIQKKEGMSVMFITHDFGVVAELANRVIVMEKGLMVEEGDVQKVLRTPAHPYTKRLLAAIPHMREEASADAGGKADVVIEIENLQKTYYPAGGVFRKGRAVHATKNVNLSIHRGETVGIVGESGSGKSTLGRIIMKLLDADSGTITFKGKNIVSISEKDFQPLRASIQMIFQDPFASLNPRQTIGNILTVGPRSHGWDGPKAESKARTLLKRVGLEESAYDRYPHEFSGGQRQRIGIARALMFDPEVLVADEAVSALDVSIQAQIIDLLKSIQDEMHITLVFITHDLRVASQICDTVVVMRHGEIVEHGDPHTILRTPLHPYTQKLVASVPGVDFWE